jgi:hypothetical protein
VTNARTELAGKPDDFQAAYALVRVLHDVGRYDETIEFGRRIMPPLPPLNQQQAFLREYVADAHSARGEAEAADALISPLLALSLDERPFLVNQYINEAIALLFRGRYEEALRLANMTGGRGTPYADGLVTAVAVCATHRLNRGEDAELLLARFPDAGDTLYGKRMAQLCLNFQDAAARTTIQILGQPGGTSLIEGFHDCALLPPVSAFAREYRETANAVRDRPEVRRAIDAVGVILTLPTPC